MSNWLRGKHDEDDTATIRPDVDAALPPSVRRPNAHSFRLPDTATLDDTADGDDTDLDFLTALASEVDRAAPPDSDGAKRPLRGASPRIDDMQVFREMKDEGRKTLRFDHKVRDVEIGDLLEELNTVRAALHLQKAA